MNKVKVSVTVILVFILGALTGSLGTQAFMKYRISKFMKRGHEARAEFIIERLSHVLELTDSQKTEVEKIIRETQKKIAEIEGQFRPRIQALMDDDFRQMRELLNDNQKQKLDEFHEHLKKRKRPGLFSPPPPPPPDERMSESYNDNRKRGPGEFHERFSKRDGHELYPPPPPPE